MDSRSKFLHKFVGTETELSRGKVIEVLVTKIGKLRSEQLVPSSQGRHTL